MGGPGDAAFHAPLGPELCNMQSSCALQCRGCSSQLYLVGMNLAHVELSPAKECAHVRTAMTPLPGSSTPPDRMASLDMPAQPPHASRFEQLSQAPYLALGTVFAATLDLSKPGEQQLIRC